MRRSLMKTIKNVICTILIGLTLIAQLINPTRAHADGDPPPPTVETAAPTETPTETAKAPQESAKPKQTSPSQALQALPNKTRVVVLDKNMHPLPLASRGTSAAFASGDPVWCPAGQ